MKQITQEDIKHLAKLSRLKLSDQEVDKFTPQIERVLESVKQLEKKDTTTIIEHDTLERSLSETRKDEKSQSLTQEEALRNAPFTENGYVKVWGTTFDTEEA